MTKRVLVTGADGFIGSHLTEALLRSGQDVRAFVYYNAFNSRGWLDRLPADVTGKLEVFAGNVCDPFGVKEAMKGCETVFHLAALIGIPYSYHSPKAYVDTNITGTLNVLQAARDLVDVRVIHTSTSEVYGSAQFVPISEEHPLQAQSPYAATKVAADQLALSFHRAFGLDVAIARPFNTYGPRQSARAVIPTIITQILSGKKTLRLGSTTPTRDFNYVSDTVAGFLRLGAAKQVGGQVINFGSNFEVSIGDTANLICEILGARNVRIECEDQRLRPEASEVDRLWADNSRAQQALGWTPEYAGLGGFKRGLQKTIEWFSDRSNLSMYRPEDYNI